MAYLKDPKAGDILSPEQLRMVDQTDLRGIGKVHIDDVIEYVHDGLRKMPTYLDLYERYLRQRWNVYELDFTQDRIDWHEKMTEAERQAFVSISSGFHHGERQVEVDLVPFMLGGSDDEKIYITSQLEDEARHTVFFDRFYKEVVGLPGETIQDVLDGSWNYISETFVGPFGLLAYLADDLRKDPLNEPKRVRFATLYHLWIEGVLALTVMKLTLSFGRERKFLPGYYTGFTATCRDEARHVQFGMRYLRDAVRKDPRMAGEIHETLRVVFSMSGAVSRLLELEPIGWSIEKVQGLMVGQLTKKLNIVGIDLPEDLAGMVGTLNPDLAGG